MAKCRSCGTEILWIKTEKGKLTPVDAVPLMHIENEIVIRDDGKTMAVVYSNPPIAGDDHKYYRSHFATCPDAGKWRKK